MLALAAAAVFALGLLLDLADASLGDAFTSTTLLFVGLLLISLHLGGVGTATGATRPAWAGRRRR